MSDTPIERFARNVTAPKSVSADGVLVDQQSLQDQIAALKFLASVESGKRKTIPIRFIRLIPPGAE